MSDPAVLPECSSPAQDNPQPVWIALPEPVVDPSDPVSKAKVQQHLAPCGCDCSGIVFT